MTLALSILALIAGPVVYALGRRHPDFRQGLDGFVFISIAGIICVFIIPEAIRVGGPAAIAFVIAGLAFPTALERMFHRSLNEAHVFILILAALGLIMHAIIDGIALLPLVDRKLELAARDDALFGSLFDNHLALGVILHRLPVGMAIWWSLRTSFGVAAAIGTFAVTILATVVAYFLGQPIAALAETESVAWFQAFVAGSLVHIVAFGVSHDHGPDHAERRTPSPNGWAYRVGVLLGMFLVFTAPHLHL